MSKELNCVAQTGLTVTAQLFKDGATVGAPITCAEIETTGVYSGDMPTVSSGIYEVVFLASGVNIAGGEINWYGTSEGVGLSLAESNKLNEIVSDPWAITIPGTYASGEAGAVLGTSVINLLTDLKDEAVGKWVLNPTAKTLTLYRIDGITVLQTFNLTVSGDGIYTARTPV